MAGEVIEQTPAAPGAAAPAAPARPAPAAPVDKVTPDKAPPVGADEFDEGIDEGDGEEVEAAHPRTDLLDDDEDAPAAAGAVSPEAKLKAVPKSAADYVIPHVKGVEWNDAGKARWGALTERLHKVGAPQGAVDAVGAVVTDLLAAQLKLDQDTTAHLQETIIADVGEEAFMADKARISGLLKSMPDGLSKEIKAARLPDGRKLVNDPRFWKWAKGQASEAHRQPPPKTPQARMKEIDEIRSTDIRRYWNEGLSDEYMRLAEMVRGGS